MRKNKGFTLIELLVVIAIIGLLASVVLVALSSVRGKARNARRLADINQYITAMEMAYDRDNEYPDPGDGWYCLGNYNDGECWANNGSVYLESATLNDIFDDFMSALPAMEGAVCGYNGSDTACREGYIYRCTARPNGICEGFRVRWLMEGDNQPCGPGAEYTTVPCTSNCTVCQVES